MSRSNSSIIDTGNVFPEMTFEAVGGSIIRLPEDFGERWNIILFYRGHW